MVFERLDFLSPVYLNEAHNEYLQILVEAGLAGGMLLAAAIVWFIGRTFSVWRQSHTAAKAASIAAGVYIIHSIVDYPLRTTAHAALAGVVLALLCSQAPQTSTRNQRA
jgi:O-antigen ligase